MMAPSRVSRQNKRARPNQRRQRPSAKASQPLRSVRKAMAKLSVRQRSRMPNASNRPIGKQERLFQKGHEFYQIVEVPSSATIGQNLFQVEVNPTIFPRLSVIASQYKQWRGKINMHVESLGNAFALSSVSAAFFPDPDPADLPADPISLLRAIDSAPSKTNLHLQDTGIKTVTAPWTLTTNPWKFCVDDEASDRANGQFLIISNGSPGSELINLKVSFSYEVTFQGNTFQPMTPVTPPILASLTLSTTPASITATTLTHPAFPPLATVGDYRTLFPLLATTVLTAVAPTNLTIIPAGSDVRLVSLTAVGPTGFSARISYLGVLYQLAFSNATLQLSSYWFTSTVTATLTFK
nr:MAG: capsid protein [Chemarfal virus 142]